MAMGKHGHAPCMNIFGATNCSFVSVEFIGIIGSSEVNVITFQFLGMLQDLGTDACHLDIF